ncbi:MAG: FAD-dependent oxidoreductase [Rhodobacteraceae bacterium]|nr:FAD-dependent oxidoreductase [Paracoccaceae bacterium]
MARDPRYDILFEPLKIGPVTAKNRFYQVPHCTGMGYLRPQMLNAMRAVKAQGGWGVVCTEYCSIHPSSDDLTHASASLWNDDDIRAHRLMTDAVHEHGALAGAELWHGGARSANHFTRLVPMDVASLPNLSGHPYQTRAMDRADIRDLRHWHRRAALRARDAGFDIVYVYATHGYLLANFLDPRVNNRGDEYGGSLENRTRLIRELIEDTKEAVGDRCAVAVRFKADETIGEDGQPEYGERREMFEMLAELPDLWDINIADYSLEMGVSRFTKEAALEPYMHWVKSVTSKPVVTVGRFTSPDTMVSQIRRGITDLIGAARPSIADPYLPNKIKEGRLEDIRECIGCNICYSGDSLGVPIRCTQNPTMGEEWRRGWHPERAAPAASDASVLIVGAGPAGLEAARTLGLRGYSVMLAEASRTLGGRVTREASLPGMSEYIRVRDYREQQLLKMTNVEVFLESDLGAEDVFEIGADHVAIATGAKWRRDRFDGKTYVPVATNGAEVLTPDDIMDGRLPQQGPVVVFDADNYYMGGVIAEKLSAEGLDVTYVTDSDSVSAWAGNTSERWRIRTRLMERGIKLVLAHSLTSFDGAQAELVCEYSEAVQHIPTNAVVVVTQRAPCDTLYHDLLARAGEGGLPFTLTRIGDCEAPAIIAAAVHAGHRYATELETTVDRDEPFRHDRPVIAAPAAALARTAAADPKYLDALLRAYEEEVEGEAWYRALAQRMVQSRHKEKMLLLAEVERATAEAVRPLIDRYGLTPAPRAALVATGQAQAARGAQDWDTLLDQMTDSFPGYVDDFKEIEALGPAADQPLLALMTAHEIAAIDFLHLEAKGDPDSTAPLLDFLLATPPASQAA